MFSNSNTISNTDTLETVSNRSKDNRDKLDDQEEHFKLLSVASLMGKKNMEEGHRPGSTFYKDLKNIPTAEYCRLAALIEQSKGKDVAGFLYRNEKHPTLPETCDLYSKVATSGNFRNKPEHLTGCVNPSKKIASGCTMTNECALKYCNTHPDLKNAFCGGNTCKSISQADKCITHWINHGKSENRSGVDSYCKHTKM